MHPFFYQILKRFGLRTYLRLSRGKTLGVRVAIFDSSGAVMLVAEGPLVLHGIFSNEQKFPGDFVCLYVLRHFRREAWKPDHEILEARFFAMEQLPKDITEGSRRRLDEIVHGQPISEHW
jgi:hypothetical protein